MKEDTRISIAEFFGWRHHPFSDTYPLAEPYLGEKDHRICRRVGSLLSYGKSLALTGPSGAGKSTLVQHIVARLDPNIYQTTFIHYGGLKRSGILRAIADAMGVDAAGRSMPLLVKLQKHILQLASQANPLYPVFVVDDAQLLERESFMDLCSLLVSPQKKTVAASLILVGDHTLAKILQLQVMAPISSRLTAIIHVEPLNEPESVDFIAFRVKSAKGPKQLLDQDALSLVAAHCRGNRRLIMNVGTLLLDEAYHRQERTVGSQLIFNCDLIDIAG
jgi:type II secretory pathway predicted ATPase ExeA